jgi:hypothetical protein
MAFFLESPKNLVLLTFIEIKIKHGDTEARRELRKYEG